MPVGNAISPDRMPSVQRNGEIAGISRRNLLAGAGAAALLAGAAWMYLSPSQPGGTAEPRATPAQRAQGRALATSEMNGWQTIVGTEFETAGFRLKLVGVQPLPSVGARPADVTRHRAFVAVFEILSGGTMPGDLIYTMRSERQVLDVFLTNASTREFPNRMHAVFN